MQIPADQIDTYSLDALAGQAVHLLCAGKFEALAASFGYAIALGRDPASAIEADLRSSLEALGASLPAPCRDVQYAVRYFEPDQDLCAVVECTLPASNGSKLLVELVVTKQGDFAHVCLEQISAAV
jgi:hypothetical protein